MAQFTNKLKTFLARELHRQFTSLDNSVGLFIAGTDYDASGVNSIEEDIKTRRQIQTVKLLTENTVSLMIPRVNWVENTIYEPYSYTADNSPRNYYVYTSERNVYICISNSGGKKSIDEPTGTGTDLIYLRNGYIWKFMYRIPEPLVEFIDEDYIPIQEIPFYPDKPFPYESTSEKQLQYSVQYNAVSGKLEAITVSTVGSEYPYVVKANSNRNLQSATINTVKLHTSANSADDVYNEYTIRIISGTGAGQYKKILDYTGSTKTATVESNFDTIPDTTSKYEIIPTINITGDGTGARAYAKLAGYNYKTIDSVVVSDNGSNYTYADVVVSPVASPTATVLIANINSIAGLGRYPLFDFNVTRLSVLTKIQGTENERAILGNDYRQYGLWLSPTINGSYEDAGFVVGTVDYKQTKVDLRSSPGATFSANYIENGDFVFGSQSYSLGRVPTDGFIKINSSTAQVTLNGLEASMKTGENVYIFKANNPDGTPSGGFTFTNKSAVVTNTLFEDSTRFNLIDTYRCTHKLKVSRNDGSDFDPANPYADISLDSGVTGASGGVGIVLSFSNIDGASGDLYVTKVLPVAESPFGFTGGETLYANNGSSTIDLSIENISPPELNLFSGQLLYITSVDQVTRNPEQIDLFKINIDF